ncbi:Signal recognition particle receptor beta subunit [Spironucleus salmonicida]|uniref:Signal recognition particle receptor subunit beta n=1 Tax=Spironucleus salmonicida TaxID=348837 RepID=V6LPY7_9EUKA|nr:Signal recognition particle receptor beta subunit [Spironucleus salmonicida]|eukprot:EST45776.1 Signal recognition particle receptor beta subunit [Spironucleus salmonicida]
MQCMYILPLMLLLPLLLLLRKKVNNTKTIVITGLGQTCKTRLFHFLISGQLPHTVKSAAPSSYTGKLNFSDKEFTLIDFPSDSRDKLPEQIDIAIIPINLQSLEQAKHIATVANNSTLVYVCCQKTDTFYKLICEEAAKLQGIEYIEELSELVFLSCQISIDTWNINELLQALSNLK